MSFPQHEAVITIRPVTDALRAEHGLPAGAVLAVTEDYEGTRHVCCTNMDCPFGVEAAARAWAEATGAAYAGTAAA